MFDRGTSFKVLGYGLCAGAAFAAALALGAHQAHAARAANLMLGATIAGSAPHQPDQPPTVPTPDPNASTWRIRLGAFPDTVGVGGYACQGCDGVFSGGDRAASAGMRLQPLMVVITEPGNPQNTYWIGLVDRDDEAQQTLHREVALPMPPPYQVNLITANPLGYTVCPNSRPVFIITQDDFDAVAGNGRPGAGRELRHDWFFWSCRAGGPVFHR